MPVPNGLRRASINAAILGGESMSHTVYFAPVQSPFEDYSLQDHADTIRDAWERLLTIPFDGNALANGLHTSTVYTDVKLYELDPDTGLTADIAQSAFSELARGNAADALPQEVALCATLETGLPGRTRKGRIYLGGFVSPLVVPTTGRIQLSNAASYAGGLARFMQESRDQDDTPDLYRAVVFSRKTSSVAPITRVSIGDVWDVQRRRRASLVEARQGVEVP